MSEKNYHIQFEILKEIAVSSVAEAEPATMANIALKETSGLLGLSAAMMILWNDRFEAVMTVTYAEESRHRTLLQELEDELFGNLRKDRHLVSAYVSFGGEQPITSFTLPIRKADKILGAVIGLQEGIGSLVREDVFLEALAAELSMALMVANLDRIVEDEKLRVVRATATTVNHRINNPLQAILGIVQLYPRQYPELTKPDDQLSEKDRMLKSRLSDIEEAAMKIMEITHKLMRVDKVEFADYIEGAKMLKLPEDTNSS
ncbi:MAG: hypothetical protein AB1746_08180 [Candidatus Zixiibacteriota bacterium]